MNKSTLIIIGIIVVGGFAYFASTSNKSNDMMQKTQESVMMETKNNAMMEKGSENAMANDEKAMNQAGSYMPYSTDKLAMAKTDKIVLFFHASWCPTCRALNSDIEKNVSNIPTAVTILKVDYDQEAELKKKFGVTTQHTLVQVDKDGNMIKKWNGGSKLENLVSEIN